MDQPPLFQPADDLDLPSRGGADPVHESASITGVTQRAGGHHPHYVRSGLLRRLVEALQNFNRARHGGRGEHAVLENGFTQTRDLAVLVNGHQAVAHQARNLDAHRVRSDIDGGEGGHGRLLVLSTQYSVLSTQYSVLSIQYSILSG